MILFASNINKLTTEEELNGLFTPFGRIVKSRIMLNQLTKRSRGCAYLDMPDNAMAKIAIDMLHNSTFMGEVIQVSESKSRDAIATAWKQ